MARPEQLPQGQIAPAARPVSAFIQPGQENIAKPTQMAQVPSVSGINTIGTGGTTFVQGENSLARLTEDLAAFNKQLIPAVQSAGLAYAEGRMNAGEQKAREQALRALANNDASMEQAQLDRAAASRALAAKDPQAGQLMAFLDPYMKIGWERGKSRLAANEAALGLPAFIAKNSGSIDYTAPDQGFGQLVKIEAEYTAQLAQKYGISPSSPGFQKYTAPELEKIRDKAATQLVADRKKFFDNAVTGQAAAELKSIYLSASANRQVEYKGNVYVLEAGKEDVFWKALSAKGQEVVARTVLSSSLPGEATERSKTIFQSLRADADYRSNSTFKYFVNSIPGNEFRRGPDNKPLIDPITQQPIRMTWGELYAQESVDSEIKYGQAGYQTRKRNREEALEGVGGYEEGLLNATSGFPPGPARQAAADDFTARWYETKGRENGISLSELQKRRKGVMELNSSLYFEGTDPEAAPTFFAQLSESQGSAFNATSWRKRLQQDASRIKDPAQQLSFIKAGEEAIKEKEVEQSKFTGYNSSRDKVINTTVNANLGKYYGAETRRNEPNREESRRRQQSAFVPFVNSRLADAEARFKRRLTDSEVRTITTQALEEYGTKGPDSKDQKDYLFPGSKFTNTPSVSPNSKPGLNQGVSPLKVETYKGAIYEVNQLDAVPNRKIRLQNFRSEPVLSADAVESLIDLASQDRPWPMKFERAWRDAGARSGAEFLLEHLDRYYPGAFQIPPQLRQKIQRRASSDAAAGGYLIAQKRLEAELPGLASLNNWAFQALLGA
jgi:hypothetical protein